MPRRISFCNSADIHLRRIVGVEASERRAAIGQELSTVRARDRLSAGGEFSENKNSGVQLVSSFWPVRYRTFLCLTNGPKKKPALEVASRAGLTVLNCAINWVQGWDLNPGPSGYEPDELPGCSTLQ